MLDRQLQKYNEAVAKNRKLRMDIDNLRKERNAYKKINLKLKAELQEKKKLMQKELKDSEEVYLRKETISKKLKDLKQDAEKQDKGY